MKIAIVHDYLVQAGGAERVVEVFHENFPEAPIYTSVYNKSTTWPSFSSMDVRTSFIQKISRNPKITKALIPLYPLAFEQFDFSNYDVVLSSTTAFAKGVITGPKTCHICYCNTPTRFIWRYHDYIAHENFNIISRMFLPPILSYLRIWDFAVAQRVDYFIAGSYNAAKRIKKYYRRESDVIHSPLDTSLFEISSDVEDYYLIVSRLNAYKRIDIAINAFNELGLPLKIIGDGPDLQRLKKMAKPNIQFLGRVSDDELREHYARCQAFILPGEEDYGLTPLEAQASGRPVIAYRAGGALETVVDGITGVFFNEQSAQSLIQAIETLDINQFEPQIIRKHAIDFDKEIFKDKIRAYIEQKYQQYITEISNREGGWNVPTW